MSFLALNVVEVLVRVSSIIPLRKLRFPTARSQKARSPGPNSKQVLQTNHITLG